MYKDLSTHGTDPILPNRKQHHSFVRIAVLVCFEGAKCRIFSSTRGILPFHRWDPPLSFSLPRSLIPSCGKRNRNTHRQTDIAYYRSTARCVGRGGGCPFSWTSLRIPDRCSHHYECIRARHLIKQRIRASSAARKRSEPRLSVFCRRQRSVWGSLLWTLALYLVRRFHTSLRNHTAHSFRKMSVY